MKTRYTLDADSGLFVDRDGRSLGRVVSITIELPAGGQGGQVGDLSSGGSEKDEADKQDGVLGETKRPTPTQLEHAAVQRVWDHWLEISGKKQRLDAKRTRIIRNALRLVGEEAVMQALLGLTRSPHHQGQNEQRRAYMEIRYALKGIGNESDDERIEKAISWAAVYATDAAKVDEAKVTRWLEDVRYTLSLPHRPEAARGKESWRKLRLAGFRVVALDKTPWARIER